MSESSKKSNSRVIVRALLFAAAMLALKFTIVMTVYNWTSGTAGVGSPTAGSTTEWLAEVDESREIQVQFMSSVQSGQPFEFQALNTRVGVNPGELKMIEYRLVNISDEQQVVQALPNISPDQVTDYIHKVKCFCFEQTVLDPGESLDMPLSFYVDSRLPEDVRSIAISFYLFKPNVAQANTEDLN